MARWPGSLDKGPCTLIAFIFKVFASFLFASPFIMFPVLSLRLIMLLLTLVVAFPPSTLTMFPPLPFQGPFPWFFQSLLICLNILNHMVPATSQDFLVSGGKVKFNQKLLLMQRTCCLGLHIHPGSWMSLQPSLDPTLACYAAGSDKHTHTTVTPLNDYRGDSGSTWPWTYFLVLMGEQSCLSRVLILSTGRWPFWQLILKLFTNIFLLSKGFVLSGRGKSQQHISVQWRGQAQTATRNDRWKQTKC